MFLSKLKNQSKLSSKILGSADFETILYNHTHYVYAIGVVFENNYKSFFLDVDKLSLSKVEESSLYLIKEFIDYSININKNNMKIFIYFHNLRLFDGIFILKCLKKFYKKQNIKVIIRNNKILKIQYKNLIFLDSLNIVNNSLNDISKLFLNKKKDSFEIYRKIKSFVDIQSYYKEISIYLFQDVFLLYEIINILYNKIFNLFNVDITKNFTISSISMSLYRKNYLNNNGIWLTKYHKYNFIKESYFGGLCNLHKPYYNKESYYYDVNSLYPSIMKDKLFPIGKGKFLYKFDTLDINNYFGFIECYIYVPKELKIPPLIVRDSNGTIIQAHGYIKGCWFTEEVKFALTKGCIIQKIYKVLHYKEKSNLFENFVTDIYNKRVTTSNQIEKTLYKSILNSLYGRFGMSLNKETTIFYDKESYLLEYFSDIKYSDEDILSYKINDSLYNKIKYLDLPKYLTLKIRNKYNKDNIIKSKSISCIQIASAISSYSRIKFLNDMYKHIENNNAQIFYYDTDSIFTDTKLDSKMVSDKELGKYKLLDIIHECVFLAPKSYSYINNNNNEIVSFKGLLKSKLKNISFLDLKNKLQKDSSLTVSDVYLPVKSNLKKLIVKDFKSNYIYTFKTQKYIKIFKDNMFIKTEPLFIEKNINYLKENNINLKNEYNGNVIKNELFNK